MQATNKHTAKSIRLCLLLPLSSLHTFFILFILSNDCLAVCWEGMRVVFWQPYFKKRGGEVEEGLVEGPSKDKKDKRGREG